MREVQCRSVLVCREDLLDNLLKTAYSEKKKCKLLIKNCYVLSSVMFFIGFCIFNSMYQLHDFINVRELDLTVAKSTAELYLRLNYNLNNVT